MLTVCSSYTSLWILLLSNSYYGYGSLSKKSKQITILVIVLSVKIVSKFTIIDETSKGLPTQLLLLFRFLNLHCIHSGWAAANRSVPLHTRGFNIWINFVWLCFTQTFQSLITVDAECQICDPFCDICRVATNQFQPFEVCTAAITQSSVAVSLRLSSSETFAESEEADSSLLPLPCRAIENSSTQELHIM